MPKEELPRLDTNPEVYQRILPLCRLSPGEVWEDPEGRHRVGVLDATDETQISRLYGPLRGTSPPRDAGSDGAYSNSSMPGEGGTLYNGLPCERRGEELIEARAGIHDPPYNILLGSKKSEALPFGDVESYMEFSRKWIVPALAYLKADAHFYLWTGADQKRGFQPLPELMLLLREFPELESRSLITLRNQRGYGTRKNWMAARQELLYYTKGNPGFTVRYTDIPKVLKGYYKTVGGNRTENTERGHSDTIRPGNVWIDVQQVFYLMEENVPGAYAQKPLKAAERIIESSTEPGEIVADHFAHSGTSLIAAEKLNRCCVTADTDPVFAEISIRRLERFRETGKTGWQWRSPFPELEAAQKGGNTSNESGDHDDTVLQKPEREERPEERSGARQGKQGELFS